MKKRKLITFLLIMVYAVTLALVPGTTYAKTTTIAFDNTNVLEDLRSSTIGGEPFNINNYPYDSTGLVKRPSIINVVEYCYSFKVNMQANYGLYLYIYNPQALEIDTTSLSNKVQIAVTYNADETPSSYEKFDLIYCNRSTEDNYSNLFYKFKVRDRKSLADGKKIIERVNSNERRYDISGIELATNGAINATEYTVGGTYKFKGYAKGYGAVATAESNITVSVNDLETISLSPISTNYRTGVSSLGKGHQNEVNSVYFSIDNAVLDRYKKLQKIKAEWYEYKTAPIVITEDKVMYDSMLPFIGKQITTDTKVDSSIPYGLTSASGYNLGDRYVYDWTYNAYYSNYGRPSPHHSDYMETTLNFLFNTNGLLTKDYYLSAKLLTDYIYSYDKSFTKGTLPIKNNTISADLFADTVDPNRTKGYNVHNIDSDDLFNMMSYDSTHEWWEKLLDYGFWAPDVTGDYKDVSPIYLVTDADIGSGNLSKTLLINERDVTSFKAYYTTQKALNKTTFLFRFAQTDYYSVGLSSINNSTNRVLSNSFYSTETVFLNFDILELTFNQLGKYIVIPVVSSPIDIINGITPPLVGENFFDMLLRLFLQYLPIIIAIIILLLCMPFLPMIISLVINILLLPFRLLGAIFGGKRKQQHTPKPRYKGKR